MKFLPYCSADFTNLRDVSAQQARFLLGVRIRKKLFFGTFANSLKNDKNANSLLRLLKNLVKRFFAAA